MGFDFKCSVTKLYFMVLTQQLKVSQPRNHHCWPHSQVSPVFTFHLCSQQYTKVKEWQRPGVIHHMSRHMRWAQGEGPIFKYACTKLENAAKTTSIWSWLICLWFGSSSLIHLNHVHLKVTLYQLHCHCTSYITDQSHQLPASVAASHMQVLVLVAAESGDPKPTGSMTSLLSIDHAFMFTEQSGFSDKTSLVGIISTPWM